MSLYDAYALLLLLVAVAFATAAIRGEHASIWQRGYGSRVRAAVLIASLTILLLSFTSAVATYAETDHDAALGKLLWTGLILGSALYSVGTASWTGKPAFWLRTTGWIVMAPALLFPSLLTMALPFLGVFAFTLVPISSRAPEGLPAG